VNRWKGLVAIQLAQCNGETIDSLLKLTQLGPWKVSCAEPNQARFSYGVISPVDVEADIRAMERRVQASGLSKFVRMERLTRSVDGRW